MLNVLANRCHLWSVHHYSSLNITDRLLISICVLVSVHLCFTAVNCVFIMLYAAHVNPLFETVQWLQKIQTYVNKVTPGNRKHVAVMFPYSNPVTSLEWPRGFQEVKFPRFHDNSTGWW